LADTARTIRLPVHVVEKLSYIVGSERKLRAELCREPLPFEIALDLDLPLERSSRSCAAPRRRSHSRSRSATRRRSRSVGWLCELASCDSPCRNAGIPVGRVD
jgi:hypothetical protein